MGWGLSDEWVLRRAKKNRKFRRFFAKVISRLEHILKVPAVTQGRLQGTPSAKTDPHKVIPSTFVIPRAIRRAGGYRPRGNRTVQ